MKVLLHACCGPCAIYPFEVLKSSGHDILGFFYNPNIYPLEEFDKRRQALERFGSGIGMETSLCPYSPEDFKASTAGWKDRAQRCLKCWGLRLKKTAEFARANDFDAFTTTLLVSPYQDHDALKKLGHEIEDKEKVDFLYVDFRGGFKKAQQKAVEMGIYRQKYCGCEFSIEER